MKDFPFPFSWLSIAHNSMKGTEPDDMERDICQNIKLITFLFMRKFFFEDSSRNERIAS